MLSLLHVMYMIVCGMDVMSYHIYQVCLLFYFSFKFFNFFWFDRIWAFTLSDVSFNLPTTPLDLPFRTFLFLFRFRK